MTTLRTAVAFAGMMVIGAAGAPVLAQDPPERPPQERPQETRDMQDLQQQVNRLLTSLDSIREQAREIDRQMGERVEGFHERAERVEEDVDRPDDPDDPAARPDPRAADQPRMMLQHEQIRGVAREIGLAADNLYRAVERVRELSRDRQAMQDQEFQRNLQQLWEQLEQVGTTIDEQLSESLDLVERMSERLDREFQQRPGR